MILTIVNPYYRNPEMLELLLDNFSRYDKATKDQLRWIIVDDASPEPAEDVINDWARAGGDQETLQSIELYRVDKDIPWNQHGARNLGAREARTPWLAMWDMDRMVLATDMRMILEKISTGKIDPGRHHKCRGYNMKYQYAISEDKQIVNQFMCTKEAYWKCGGYDEDYCGIYGGDGPLLRLLEKAYPLKIHNDLIMFRYDRHIVPDSTTTDLERHRGEYGRLARQKTKRGHTNDKNSDFVRFPYHRVGFDWSP